MSRWLILLSCLFSFSLYAQETFTLHTSALNDQGTLPVDYTCDGKDISPEFDWRNFPDKTESFAFIMHDLDAPGGNFYHWVVYNIPKTILSFPQGMEEIPTGVMVGKNSWQGLEYKGPCPPKGKPHRYVFTLYALDSELKLPAGQTGEAVKAAIQKHILGEVQITGTYQRGQVAP